MSMSHSTSNEEAHLDGPILAELEEIMEDDFGVLLEAYIDDASQKIELLDGALEAHDAPAIRELSHSLKGASSNIGALPLSQLFETVEHLAKDENVSEIVPLLAGIQTEFTTIRALLEAKL
jgi:HPt (histidine-containing phosphotransfer) domain-containing protein